MKFKVGQKVVYVGPDFAPYNLLRNSIYEIEEIKYCQCGQVLDIGIIHAKQFVYCSHCNQVINEDSRYFIDSCFFIPYVDYKVPEKSESFIEQWVL